MFVDSSAIVAILADEPDSKSFLDRLDQREFCLTSPLAVLESVIRLAAILGLSVEQAQALVADFLEEAGIVVSVVDENIGRLAVAAFDRYGKGRHPAKLNFGDCFSYAMAKHQGVALLHKGNDFAQTDLA
jgi:ribonuclease VapC